MANLYRLVLLLACLFSSHSVFALVPKVTVWYANPGPGFGPFSTREAACSASAAWFDSQWAASGVLSSNIDCPGGRVERQPGNWYALRISSAAGVCPANSVPSGSACACSVGFVESGDQCVPDKPAKDPVCGGLEGMSMGVSSVESDFGKQSTGWAASALGTKGNACISGCQVSGTIGGCVVGGSAVCMVNSPSFTGASCSTETEGNSNDGCPEETILQPVSGLCVPKQNSCPANQEPSKYVEGICIPKEASNDGKCEDPKDPSKRIACEGKNPNCSSGKVPSKVTPNTCVPAVDGSEKGKNGDTYSCSGGTCTVTKGDCTPSEGNTCTLEKSQGDACKEAPELKQCTQDTGITGSCAGSFQCKGDALQCAMAVEQHKRNCELFEKQNDYSRLFDNLKSAQTPDGALKGTEVDLAGHFKVDSVIGNGVCPADITVMVMDRPIPVRLSQFCQYFNAMGYMLFLGACISCLRILGT